MEAAILGVAILLVVVVAAAIWLVVQLRASIDAAKNKLVGEHQAVVGEKDRMITLEQKRGDDFAERAAKVEQSVTSISSSMAALSTQAVNEVKQMAKILSPVIGMFKTPQIAGIEFGEGALELLLEKHLGSDLFERKPRRLAQGNDVVDFAIKLPDCTIPIDSKFPSGVYRAWADVSENTSESERKARWRDFRDAIMRQMELTARYIQPAAGTTDYALLFLPSDVIWHQAFATPRWYGEQNPVPTRSHDLRVFGCSAQTLMPYLSLLRLGLKNLSLADDYKGIQQDISQLKQVFVSLEKDWGVVRGHVDNAQRKLLDMEGSKGSFWGVKRIVESLHGLKRDKRVTEGAPTVDASVGNGVNSDD